MMEQQNQPVLAHNFSVAFEQMCVMAAVSQTCNSQEILQELILFCFTRFPEEKNPTSKILHDEVLVMSGLDFSQYEIDVAIEQLIKNEKIIDINRFYSMQLDLKLGLLKQVDEADKLEEAVKSEWLLEVINAYPLIPLEFLWKALKNYLSCSFRRHGIQTVSLLDPAIGFTETGSDNLSTLLDQSVDIFIDRDQKEIAKELIRNFMASVGKSYNRTKYISQMADCAFNYFALAIIPETAQNFRNNLLPLTLYLDTNFLFGVLDLTVNPQVAVSKELLEAIKKFDLPFNLNYHQKTENELLRSISTYKTILQETKWQQNISKGIFRSRAVSGVELRYHQRNSEIPIDVEAYFLPFEHSDMILTEKNILKVTPESERISNISVLSTNYSQFLERKRKDKPDALIDHDMTVLDTVRTMRTKAKNSLDAGALLITCDYTLYGFDWETSKHDGTLPCTVLPNLLWQLLRPFIPTDGDFDRSFAETFALPEFRLIGSKSSITASKMAALLSSFKGMTEELATKLLSNDLLIGKLRNFILDEVTFKEQIELAIVEEHAELEEDYSLLHEKLENSIKTNSELSSSIVSIEKELEKERKNEKSLLAELELNKAKSSMENNQNQENEKRLIEEKEELNRLIIKEREEHKNRLKILITAFLSIVLITAFEITVYKVNWKWFINHSNIIGLQGCVCLLIPLILTSIIIPKYRKSTNFTGLAVVIISIILSIIDGK